MKVDVTPDALAAASPRWKAAHDAALEAWSSTSPKIGCRHVVREHAGALLLVCHPNELLCDPCSRRHLRRGCETPKGETPCIECGVLSADAKLDMALAFVQPEGDYRIRDASGFSRILDEPYGVAGLFLCGAHMTRELGVSAVALDVGDALGVPAEQALDVASTLVEMARGGSEQP